MRHRTFLRKVGLASGATVAAIAITTAGLLPVVSSGGISVAGATGPNPAAVYNSIPSPLPGNESSVGVEAYSYDEIGDRVGLAGGAGQTVIGGSVMFSSWNCQNGGVFTAYGNPGACTSAANSTYTWPVRFNLYAVDTSGPIPKPGALLATSGFVSQTFPYRPTTENPSTHGCDGTSWYSATDASCYHGIANKVSFSFPTPATNVPAQVIWTVDYNSNTEGHSPTGTPGLGDSLNVAFNSATGPTVGTDVDPNGIVWDTKSSGFECGAATPGVLELDDGCWSPLVPAGELDVAQSASIQASVITNEGNAGATVVNVPVTLAGPSPGPVTMNWTTANGTAKSGGSSDYLKTTGVLTIPAGQTTGTISVTVNGDTKQEPNEAFSLNVSNPTGATLSNSSSTITIKNDDAPTITVSKPTATEGSDLLFVVTLKYPDAVPLNLTYSTADGSAHAPVDYTAAAASPFTVPPGVLTYTVHVPTHTGDGVEKKETMSITVNGAAAPKTANGYISANAT